MLIELIAWWFKRVVAKRLLEALLLLMDYNQVNTVTLTLVSLLDRYCRSHWIAGSEMISECRITRRLLHRPHIQRGGY